MNTSYLRGVKPEVFALKSLPKAALTLLHSEAWKASEFLQSFSFGSCLLHLEEKVRDFSPTLGNIELQEARGRSFGAK